MIKHLAKIRKGALQKLFIKQIDSHYELPKTESHFKHHNLCVDIYSLSFSSPLVIV